MEIEKTKTSVESFEDETKNVEQGLVEKTTNDELDALKQFIAEKQERIKWKVELKSKNAGANVEALRLDSESKMTKLDSSIKKVTAFIKRLRTLTESQRDTLLREICQLNLSKYLSEVTAAFVEAKLKMNDVACALALCSHMHQTYAEFAALLLEQWQKVLNMKRDDKVRRITKCSSF